MTFRETRTSKSYAEKSINRPNFSNIRDLSDQPILNGHKIDVLYDKTELRRYKHPEFALESSRLSSFTDWPKSMKQRPAQLADAGFFYAGRGDCVACFSCGCGLKDWEADDLPFEQHSLWFDKCEYLVMMKGHAYIQQVQARKFTRVSSETITSNRIDSTNDAISDNKICKICFVNESTIAFIPCGHVISCTKCSFGLTKCPCCRQSFTSLIKIYFS